MKTAAAPPVMFRVMLGPGMRVYPNAVAAIPAARGGTSVARRDAPKTLVRTSRAGLPGCWHRTATRNAVVSVRPRDSRAGRSLRETIRQPAGTPRQRGGAAAPARRLRLGTRRSMAPHQRRAPALLRDMARDARLRWPGHPPLAQARCWHLGDPRRWRPPRPLQAHGLARPRPCL